jgi:hypothetical protein
MKRPLLYLLVVVVVGIAVLWLEHPGAPPSDDSQVVRFFPNLDPAAVQTLTISRLMTGVTLQKGAEGWTATTRLTPLAEKAEAAGQQVADPVVTIPADPQLVERALTTLKTIESRSLISRDAQANPRFEVNDIGTHVQAIDASGQVLADIYLGKTGPDLLTTAVRREGEHVVYLARGHMSGQFPAEVEAWKTDNKK